MKQSFYITTTLPYVNADPHIGFALEIVQADTVARYYRQNGYDVVFNTGTDEHGQKIYQKAVEAGLDPQEYCDKYAARFQNLKKALNLSYTNFIRTTSDVHKKAAQHFWLLCFDNGDIYKKNYQIKYCVGCELEKTDSELEDGKCPLHPNTELEIRNEENYFFRFSKYQGKLLELYQKQSAFVLPVFRLDEIKSFVSKGLNDFSISRLKSKMPWGIEVPNDRDHVMYVWFDALINYISTIGWPKDSATFNSFWPGTQVAGKDNLRQQSAMWQAMLMSAQLSLSKQIFIHGFITSDGKKMSKSLGNVIDPFNIVTRYGTDAVRYYLLREIPSADDGDFSESRMEELYSSDLANELGNLVSRITTLQEKNKLVSKLNNQIPSRLTGALKKIELFQFNLALEEIWIFVKETNKKIDVLAPWKKDFTDFDSLNNIIDDVYAIGLSLRPFLPESSQKITEAISKGVKSTPLFPKLTNDFDKI